MRGSELAEAMAVAVDRLVSAREGTGTLDRAIESIVGTIGRFGGKDMVRFDSTFSIFKWLGSKPVRLGPSQTELNRCQLLYVGKDSSLSHSYA